MSDLASLRARLDALFDHPALPRVLSLVLFFLLVASARLFCLHLYGGDIPYSDQWDSEGWNWLKAYQEGKLDWNVLFLPHNEHRVAFVRLWVLALFSLNDHQWDNLVETSASALLVAAAATIAFRTLQKQLSPRLWPVPALLLAACCVPCGYENLLVGFQLQVYLLVAFAVCGVWLAAASPLRAGTAVVIAALALASLFTMASGLFTPVAIGIALALRLWTSRALVRRYLWLAVAMLVVLGAGIQLLVTVPGHEALRARDVLDWLDGMATVGSWPLPVTFANPFGWIGSWIAFVIVWLPFATGVFAVLRRRDVSATSIAAAALGAWTLLQVAGIAYGRARDLAYIHSRYTDILVVTLLVNAYFCLRLVDVATQARLSRRQVVAAAAWLTVTIAGYAVQGVVGLIGLQSEGQSRKVQTDTVNRYLHVRDSSALATALSWNLPYPNKARLKTMLDDKTIRDILPAGERLPLSLGQYTGTFLLNGMPSAMPRTGDKLVLGSFAPLEGDAYQADMTTPALHSRFRYLLFPVAGYLGKDGLTLSLDSVDGARHAVVPASVPGPAWGTVTVTTPGPDFVIRAHDSSSEQWFAFAAPVEIGVLSYWMRQLLDTSPALLCASLLAVYFLIQFRWLRRVFGSGPNDTGNGQIGPDAKSPA
jgi:hypothetical protein